MAKNKEARGLVTLVCSKCKNQNYSVSKNRKNTTERLELNKFCKHCREVTPHNEKK